MDAETIFLLAKALAGPVAILTSPGAPTTGTWFTGALALDSKGVLWVCEAGGTPGTWAKASTQWLTPTPQSSNYTAASGDYVEATASITVTSPANTSGNKFGVIANYAASNGSAVTVTASTGYLIGPGIPASTSSILLGTENANITFVSDGTNWLQTAGAQDSGWVTPSFASGWGGYLQIRLVGSVVSLRGYLSEIGSPSSTIFTIPAGMTPPNSIPADGVRFSLAASNGTSVSVNLLEANTAANGSGFNYDTPVVGPTPTDLFIDGLSWSVV